MKLAIETLSLRSVRGSGLAMAMLLVGGAGLTACHKDEEPAKASPPAAAKPEEAAAPKAPEPQPTPPPESKPVAEVPASPPAANAEPGISDKELSQKVAAFKAFHPFNTGSQLLQMPQFSSPLASVLDQIAKDSSLLERVKKTSAAATGAENASSVSLDLKVSNYTLSFADRLLAAVLSGQPGRLVDLVLKQPSSAEFQISAHP